MSLTALKSYIPAGRSPWIIALVLAGLLAGCAPLGLLDQLVPEGDYQSRSDVNYGDHPRQKLDIYRPPADTGTGPIVVFFYGGSWKSGAREKYRFVGEALTRRGLTVIVPDYRLYPEVRFPAFMTDAARATSWTLDNLRAPDGRKRPVFLAGHSAGAHIAALLAVDDQYLEQAGLSPSDICGVIGLAGPYAFDPFRYRTTRAVFAGIENSDVARPARLVRGITPPFLLLHGDSDGTGRPSNTRDFSAALRAGGSSVRTEILPDIGHYRIVLAMATPFDTIAPVNDRIAEFVAANANCR